jgi:hypothetical protein
MARFRAVAPWNVNSKLHDESMQACPERVRGLSQDSDKKEEQGLYLILDWEESADVVLDECMEFLQMTRFEELTQKNLRCSCNSEFVCASASLATPMCV